jgi:hypothetical protein
MRKWISDSGVFHSFVNVSVCFSVGDLMNNPVSWGHWFKVEVSKGNINYRWRNYAVKKATTEDNIIQEFLTKHNLKVV